MLSGEGILVIILVGLVAGTAKGDDWLVVIKFIADGYIKDNDAKSSCNA